MDKFRMKLANRSWDIGSVRFHPGDYFGMVELGDGVTPERVTRAMHEGLVILEKVEEPAEQEPRYKIRKNKMRVEYGISN